MPRAGACAPHRRRAPAGLEPRRPPSSSASVDFPLAGGPHARTSGPRRHRQARRSASASSPPASARAARPRRVVELGRRAAGRPWRVRVRGRPRERHQRIVCLGRPGAAVAATSRRAGVSGAQRLEVHDEEREVVGDVDRAQPPSNSRPSTICERLGRARRARRAGRRGRRARTPRGRAARARRLRARKAAAKRSAQDWTGARAVGASRGQRAVAQDRTRASRRRRRAGFGQSPPRRGKSGQPAG